LAIGSTLAGEGATVIINARSEKRVAEALQKIRQKYPYAKLEALISDLSKVEAVKHAVSRFPHVDILVNNLGIYEISLLRTYRMRPGRQSSNELHERRMLESSLPPADEGEELGQDPFHLE
jgi:NAD(P)-dependent dehydrogenase (short-subunit alcohol dehydrogenase family)